MLVTVEYASKHLSQLLRAVENGETVIITRNGIPVAELVKYEKPLATDQSR